MTEAAGLAVGVVALAGLFNNAVECFEFIQLGRAFGKDLQTSQLKLDNARLRLSRWGKALDLDEDIQDTTSLSGRVGTASDIKHAEDLLGQIVELFAEAEGVSSRYKSRKAPQDDSLVVYDPHTDLDPAMTKLHDKTRQLAIERQNKSGLRQKAKWALYQEKNFRRLIEDISELVDSLVDLFPAAQQAQRELCEAELAVIGDSEVLPMLKEIAAAQDKFLEEAIKKTNPANTSYNITFSGSNNHGQQIAHNSATMTNYFGGGGRD